MATPWALHRSRWGCQHHPRGVPAAVASSHRVAHNLLEALDAGQDGHVDILVAHGQDDAANDGGVHLPGGLGVGWGLDSSRVSECAAGSVRVGHRIHQACARLKCFISSLPTPASAQRRQAFPHSRAPPPPRV